MDQPRIGRSSHKSDSNKSIPSRNPAKSIEEQLYRDAFREYPALRQVGSPIRREFLVVHGEICMTDPNFLLQNNWPLLIAKKAAKKISNDAGKPYGPEALRVKIKPNSNPAFSMSSGSSALSDKIQNPKVPSATEVISESIKADTAHDQKTEERIKTSEIEAKEDLEPNVQEIKNPDVSEAGSSLSVGSDIPSSIETAEANPQNGTDHSEVNLPFTEEHAADIAKFVGDIARSNQMVHVDSYQRGDFRVEGYTREPQGGFTVGDDIKVAAVQLAVIATIASVEAGGHWIEENKGEISKKASDIKKDIMKVYEDSRKQAENWFK
jgi:hypothetical protein